VGRVAAHFGGLGMKPPTGEEKKDHPTSQMF
jgi:hypothetical protein